MKTLNESDPSPPQSSRAERRRELRAERKTQRRLDALVAADDNAGIGSTEDKAFFEQHPERNYRMRLATPNEVATTALLGGETNTLPDARFDWMVIWQVRPGKRMRMGLMATIPPGYRGGEIPEAIARATYEHFRPKSE